MIMCNDDHYKVLYKLVIFINTYLGKGDAAINVFKCITKLEMGLLLCNYI